MCTEGDPDQYDVTDLYVYMWHGLFEGGRKLLVPAMVAARIRFSCSSCVSQNSLCPRCRTTKEFEEAQKILKSSSGNTVVYLTLLPVVDYVV